MKIKIPKTAVTAPASEGRITLQVPMLVIGKLRDDEIIEVAADHFVRLRNEGRRKVPCVGKERGFMFLSRAGWEHYKPAIRAAFAAAKHPRGTWDDFEKYAEAHFAAVQASAAKLVAKLEQQLAAARAFRV